MLKIAYSPSYVHPLPEGHRFPMEKYELLPGQLLHERIVRMSNFFTPQPLEEQWILAAHDLHYWSKLSSLSLSKSEARATGFPLSKQLVEREVLIAGGSVQAALFALEFGIAMNIAGGTHHAFSDRGEGFCLLNDLAITANYLLKQQLRKKVLIVDLDVHQGNGTASICKANPDIFTFSMHGAKNYPHHKEISSMDVELADGTTDHDYLNLLDQKMSEILRQFNPDFIIYQSGVDVLHTDKLGRLGMTIPGVKQRDKKVLEFARELSAPVMCCMGGGYSADIGTIIDAHSQLYRVAQDLYF